MPSDRHDIRRGDRRSDRGSDHKEDAHGSPAAHRSSDPKDRKDARGSSSTHRSSDQKDQKDQKDRKDRDGGKHEGHRSDREDRKEREHEEVRRGKCEDRLKRVDSGDRTDRDKRSSRDGQHLRDHDHGTTERSAAPLGERCRGRRSRSRSRDDRRRGSARDLSDSYEDSSDSGDRRDHRERTGREGGRQRDERHDREGRERDGRHERERSPKRDDRHARRGNDVRGSSRSTETPGYKPTDSRSMVASKGSTKSTEAPPGYKPMDMRSMVVGSASGSSRRPGEKLAVVTVADTSSGSSSGRKQIDKFLAEIKTKHIMPEDLSRARQIHVRPPDNPLRQVIDVLAKFVAKQGEEFEDAVRADVGRRRHEILETLGVTRDEVDFKFLEEGAETHEALYYRWRTFAYCQGDGGRHWRTEPFQMCHNGTIWYPPPEEQSDSSVSRSRSPRSRSRSKSRSRTRRTSGTGNAEGSQSPARGGLPKRRRHPAGSGRLQRKERRELVRLQDELSPQVGEILKAMCWCLDRADCAVEVAQSLIDGLLEPGLTLVERLVRLFLISDVVHNSGSTVATSAWCYRQEFEAHLPEAFERLRTAYCAEGSRLATERAEDQVLRIFRSWQSRAVFTAQFVKGLETSFFRDIVSSDGLVPPGSGAGGGAARGSPHEGIFLKLAEWRLQHFSQLEKLGKARGLNWQTAHLQRPDDGRSLEEVRKKWLLDRLVTYEIYMSEVRPAQAAPPRPETPVNLPPGMASALVVLAGSSGDETMRLSAPRAPAAAAAAAAAAAPVSSDDLDGEPIDDIDGSPLSSDDEALCDEVEGRKPPRPTPEAGDIDGVPLEIPRGNGGGAAAGGGAGANGTSKKVPPRMINYEDDDDDDDIDGVPMRLEDLSRFKSGTVNLQR